MKGSSSISGQETGSFPIVAELGSSNRNLSMASQGARGHKEPGSTMEGLPTWLPATPDNPLSMVVVLPDPKPGHSGVAHQPSHLGSSFHDHSNVLPHSVTQERKQK